MRRAIHVHAKATHREFADFVHAITIHKKVASQILLIRYRMRIE